MAKAREIEGFAEAGSFAAAAALAVDTRTDELFSFSEGVLDTSDIERVHDMRVASRRLRAALEIFAPCFPKREHRQVRRFGQSVDTNSILREPSLSAFRTLQRRLLIASRG